MRDPVPDQYDPRRGPHGRPGGSHRRHGNEGHRLTGPTQPLGSWLDGLPHPEPDLDSVEVLKNQVAQPACSNLQLSTEEAFGRAYQAIEHYQRTQFACLAPGQRDRYPAGKLPFMVFDQLDRELFRSVLKGNVCLIWVTELPNGIHATTYKVDRRRYPRITIKLSTGLTEAPRVDVLCTLMHQMMHAYFLQCCGHQAQDGGSGGHDLCHGPEFRALLLTIGRRCSLDGHQFTSRLTSPLPLPSKSQPMSSEYESPWPSWSNCYTSASPMRDADRINNSNWREMAIATVRSLDEKPKPLPAQASDLSRALGIIIPAGNGAPSPMLDFPTPAKARVPRISERNFYFIDPTTSTILPPRPRSQYALPSESYIELHFRSHAFPLPRDRIAPHVPMLAESPCLTDKRILVLPAWSDSTDLVILYAFLLGTRSPSAPDTRSDQARLPIIGTHDPKSTPLVKSYVSAYHLALALAFRPLAIHAVDALQSLRVTHENPIAVLERIYHPPDSVPQVPGLRQWTRDWLAVRIPPADGWEHYAATYPTNLSVIKEHPDWKAAYVALREKGTGLVTDLDGVEAATAQPTPQQPPRPPARHGLLLSLLPPTAPKEPIHPPISPDPHPAPSPFYFPPPPSADSWHDMPARPDARLEERRRKRNDDEVRRQRQDDEARKRQKEDDARRKRTEDDARRKRQDDDARKKREDEERRRNDEPDRSRRLDPRPARSMRHPRPF